MAALDQGLIGRRETKICYMRLFPSDVLLKHRLGAKVWQMYAMSEADLASRSRAQAQQNERQRAAQEKETAATELRLSAGAQAFKPSSSSTIAAAASQASLSCLHGLSCNGAGPKLSSPGEWDASPPLLMTLAFFLVHQIVAERTADTVSVPLQGCFAAVEPEHPSLLRTVCDACGNLEKVPPHRGLCVEARLILAGNRRSQRCPSS